MKTYKTLIIHNQSSETSVIKQFILNHCKYIEIVKITSDIFDGIETFLETSPDILLINIDKASEDIVFTTLDNLPKNSCEIIFISASKDFGVKAIQYNAVGYLIPPITLTDFKLCLAKAVINIQKRQLLDTKFQVPSPTASQNGTITSYPNHIAISNNKYIDIIHTHDIVYAEAQHRYTIFHLLKKDISLTVSKNLGYYEDILDPKMFFRIHNKYIINISMVRKITKTDGLYCKLSNNKSLPISKRRQEALFKSLYLRK